MDKRIFFKEDKNMDIDTYENPVEVNDLNRPVLIEHAQKNDTIKSKTKFYDLDHWALIRCQETEEWFRFRFEKPVLKGTQLIGWQPINLNEADIDRDIQMNGHSHTRQSAEEFLRKKDGVESGFEVLDQ
ncbi:MAG: hypothetical protein LBD60_00830 [Puniceicoccales bacterium]|jgi:hypothetical protein|nr:hypothetical protein [Puniceicoccales bacterium]